MSTTTEKVSPKKAFEYLGTMKKNRKVRKALVDRYAAEMKADQWRETGEPIKFNKAGELIDGQHRLSAIIQANKTVILDVRRGLEDEVFMNLDTGGARTPGDLLYIAGYNYTSNTASTIRQALSILEVESGVLSPTSMNKKKVPPAELLEWAHEHQEEMVLAVKTTMTTDAKLVCSPPSLFAALYFLFAQYNASGARDFFNILIQGIGFEHEEGDPVYQLRKQLLTFKSHKNLKRPTYYKAALVIKAWNAFQNRETILTLKFGDNETWPEINRRRSRVSSDAALKSTERASRRKKQLKDADKRRQSRNKKKK